jgi:hypothetical protein
MTDVKLWHDPDVDRPGLDDDAIKIVVFHRKYTNPNPECGSTPDEVQGWCEANDGLFWWKPLYMYDHSGTTYSTSPFSCPWDSGRVGIIALLRSEFPDPATYAEGLLKEYTAWANGDTWGWTRGDENCGGFYSREAALEDAYLQ